MSGTHRIIVGEIAQGKSRGDALKKELARMNEMPDTKHGKKK